MKRRVPRVGDVVLLRVDTDVQLPLIVTRVAVLPRTGHEATRWTVSGQVFTDPDVHGEAAWVRDNRFWKPSAEQPTFLLSNVPPGRGLGEWEFGDARADR